MGVNYVEANGEELVNLMNDTVAAETLAEGTTAHDAAGNAIVGVAPTDAVRYKPQTLSAAQQQQARANIGAASVAEVDELSEALPEVPLIGSTAEITPSQIMDAVKAGRDVAITYTDATYGAVTFSAFMFSSGFRGVFSSEILYYVGSYVLVELYGMTNNNSWHFYYTLIATADDIPTALPNPYALTINNRVYDGSAAVNFTDTINLMIDAKLGVIENGSY